MLMPRVFRLVGRLLANVHDRINRAMEFIQPILDERLRKEQEFAPDWPDKPVSSNT